jgi:hypothetical protein
MQCKRKLCVRVLGIVMLLHSSFMASESADVLVIPLSFLSLIVASNIKLSKE